METSKAEIKMNILKFLGVYVLAVGLIGGCSDRSGLVDKDKVFWGRTTADFIGIWKADGRNYGEYYKSRIVDLPTIKSLMLELSADGTFKAMNWPFEEWSTGQVVVVPAFTGAWSYKYSVKDRFGVLDLCASKKQPFNHIGATLYWMPEIKGKTLRLTCQFADFLYLEKVGSPDARLNPTAEDTREDLRARN